MHGSSEHQPNNNSKKTVGYKGRKAAAFLALAATGAVAGHGAGELLENAETVKFNPTTEAENMVLNDAAMGRGVRVAYGKMAIVRMDDSSSLEVHIESPIVETTADPGTDYRDMYVTVLGRAEGSDHSAGQFVDGFTPGVDGVKSVDIISKDGEKIELESLANDGMAGHYTGINEWVGLGETVGRDTGNEFQYNHAIKVEYPQDPADYFSNVVPEGAEIGLLWLEQPQQ